MHYFMVYVKYYFASLTLFWLLIAFASCNRAKNYKDAYVVVKNNKPFIKLKGRRNLMVHDPISLLENKTYEDSVFVPLSNLKDGNNKTNVVIDLGGVPILWKGVITINNKELKLYLFDIYLTSKNKVEVEAFSWNGEYHIVN